ncbi:MAG TPA: hypothetical protein VF638_00925 [Sphingomonas sp.]|jgi:hypothetical protein
MSNVPVIVTEEDKALAQAIGEVPFENSHALYEHDVAEVIARHRIAATSTLQDQVERLHDDVAPAIEWTPGPDVPGAYRVGHSLPPHLADGMTAQVCIGGGAFSTIPNPQSYESGGIVWHLTYATEGPYRLCAGSIISTFDYLLSDAITMKDATARLRTLRTARAALTQKDISR